MKVLVINAGSSSLKYQLIDMDTGSVIAKGVCERIVIEGSSITHKRPGKDKYFENVAIANHDEAIALVMKTLTDAELGVIASVDEIDAIGHRAAHGGVELSGAAVVDEKVLAYLESIVELNPLHGPPAIAGMKAAMSLIWSRCATLLLRLPLPCGSFPMSWTPFPVFCPVWKVLTPP